MSRGGTVRCCLGAHLTQDELDQLLATLHLVGDLLSSEASLADDLVAASSALFMMY